jgi:hypothetical protein
MDQAGLATQQDLLNWANTTAARSELPRLICRLVLETDNVSLVDFPAGEGTVTGGWDGVSVCEGSRAIDSEVCCGCGALGCRRMDWAGKYG